MKIIVLLCLVAVTLAQFHNPDENEDVNDPLLIQGDIRRIDPITRGSMRKKLWPNGVAPYVFSPYFAKQSSYVWTAKEAMKVWSKVSCVKFVKRTNERDYLYFTMAKGCWSYYGKVGGQQRLSLGLGCNWEGIAVHELGHALGFVNEQSRPDRDKYVIIRTQNIKPGKRHHFYTYTEYVVDSLGTPYDYGSVMHSGPYAYTKNFKATIIAKKPGVYFGQRVGPSKIDIQQMRKLYKCKDTPYIEYGAECSWRTEKAAYRCWRYCNPKFPKKGAWCWTNKSCSIRGWPGLYKHRCPASVSFAQCATKCGL